MLSLGLLHEPTRFLFFTGKGGVGKTSVSTATAIALADRGARVLLVSTDAASNLDEMLGVPLRGDPTEVPGAPGLALLHIDPEEAAEEYRRRVLAEMSEASETDRATVREQLSGACTTEIASFDAFARLLAEGAPGFDHVVFDTAPTGHTLRLLSLPRAWTGFLAGNDRGASCLGPHSGLTMHEARFRAALEALSDAARTTVVLVTLPDPRPIAEAARAAAELKALGIVRQRLVVNGVFTAEDRADPVALALEARGRAALADLPPELAALPRDEVPLRPVDNVGLPALRALLDDRPPPIDARPATPSPPAPPLTALVSELAAAGHGLLMVMGKGGVGKTTLAAAIAVQLAERGHRVLLTTTDPAAHLTETLAGEVPGLTVGRIDPAAETQRYVERILATRGRELDEAGRALLLEDLRSPCTEEVAVFHAFSRVIGEAKRSFVVLDTAPTGHSLLLMDATGAYHRQSIRTVGEALGTSRITTPLMRLQDASLTRVIVVTLPEATPVSQAAALEQDLLRAGVVPYAWVLNRSLSAAGPTDPLLRARLVSEERQRERVRGLAARLFEVPWVPEPPVGRDALVALAEGKR